MNREIEAALAFGAAPPETVGQGGLPYAGSQVSFTKMAPAIEEAEVDDGYIAYLFQRGRVEFTPEVAELSAAGSVPARKTHRLVLGDDGTPTLERIGFDCGFD